MMGTSVKMKPIRPPSGVDAAAFDAAVDREARARVALEQRMQQLLAQQAWEARDEERRRRRQVTRWALGLILVVAVLLTAGGVGAVAVAGLVAVWWHLGHPGLRTTRDTPGTSLQRRQ